MTTHSRSIKDAIAGLKCRKGTADGTTKRGAYWNACSPIKIRRAGGDGIGHSTPDITFRLHCRHYRDGSVTAVVECERCYHQNGSNTQWQGCNAILAATTIEEAVVCLKGTAMDESPVFSESHGREPLTRVLSQWGLPESAPAPDDAALIVALIVPDTDTIPSEHRRLVGRLELRLTTDHPASRYGLGVLLDADDEILDGARFIHLRDTLQARIETTDTDAVCAALGLPRLSDPVNVGGLHPARGINGIG